MWVAWSFVQSLFNILNSAVCFFFPFPLTYGISSGTDNDSARGHANESIMEQSGDAETEDDDEASDTDQMHDLEVDGQSSVGASESMRFYILYIS